MALKNNTNLNDKVQTQLSIHPDWNIPTEEVKIYEDIHNQLPPLEPSHISIQFFGSSVKNGQLIISAFVRNTTNQACRLGKTQLTLMGPNSEVLAKKIVDLNILGNIPSMFSRSWHFTFDKRELLSTKIPKRGLKLFFDLSKH